MYYRYSRSQRRGDMSNREAAISQFFGGWVGKAVSKNFFQEGSKTCIL
jgi:hypothetical protein